MKTAIAWFLGAFAMFAALGYHLGTRSASDPYRLALYIASKTDVSLSSTSLVMRFRGPAGVEYWNYDLENTKAKFETADLMRKSLRPKALSAESELLLQFVGGGALAIKAKDIVAKLQQGMQKGDFVVQLATVVGGATGFGVGYYFGVNSITSDSPALLASLRDKKQVEQVKKLVFLSMLSKTNLDQLSAEDQAAAIASCPAEVAKSNCILLASGDAVLRSAWRARLYMDAKVRLSSDELPLEGHEFMLFFI